MHRSNLVTWLGRVACICALAAAVALPAHAGIEVSGEDLGNVDLTELSLEELLDIEVTIASLSSQKMSDVPGAVYVLTGDEIRRSGHNSVQEALRMVPGFYVSNWSTSLWDVTSRGFGTGLSLTSLAYLNELLVVLDGVVVYTPLFGGTWWSNLDMDMNDIDRIEVIRGPGGVLWGSNAVHGVVHIITKSPEHTQGTRVSVRGGTDDRQASLTHSGRLGKTGTYRVYYRESRHDTHHNPFMGYSQDWQMSSAGMRFDWGAVGERRTSVMGRFYKGFLDGEGYDLTLFEPINVTDDKQGFQLRGSTVDADGKGTLSAWVSTDQQDLKTDLDVHITSYDVEYKRDFDMSETSKVTAGLGFRQHRSDLEGDDPDYLFFDPEREIHNIGRLFAVGTWMFPSSRTSIVVGGALEYNDYTEYVFQPTVRGTWQASENVATWAAITKGARTPSFEEVRLDANSIFVGNPDFESEEVLSYELGVRTQVGEHASIDIATFFNEYDNLHVEEFDGIGQDILTNNGRGESYGAELALDMKPFESWSLRSAYTFIAGSFENSVDGSDLGTDDYHPRHQINLRSYYDISDEWELDCAVYIVEDMGKSVPLPEGWRFDLRLGWHPCDDIELYVGGQQLNENTESELDEFDNLRRQFFIGMNWTP